MAVKVLKNLIITSFLILFLFFVLGTWIYLGARLGIFADIFTALDLLSSLGFLIASLVLTLGKFYISTNLETNDPNNLTLFIMNNLSFLLLLGGLSYGGYVFKDYYYFFVVLDILADGCIGALLVFFFWRTFIKLNTMINRKFTI